MWGAYDWGAIRTTVDTSASIKEGYFASFLLQNILFDGKILPVINKVDLPTFGKPTIPNFISVIPR